MRGFEGSRKVRPLLPSAVGADAVVMMHRNILRRFPHSVLLILLGIPLLVAYVT